MVPLISWVSAGRWREPDVSLDAPLEWLPVTFTTPNVFALRVEGDSMEPDYPPGHIIFVDPDAKPEAMDLVVALNGSVDILPALKDGDSHNWRSMSRTEKDI